MGNLKFLRRLSGFCFAAFLLSACGARMNKELRQGGAPAGPQNAQISGTVVTSDNQSFDLATIKIPLVLGFASDACSACTEEAKDFSTHFQSTGGVPKNALLLTVLIGATAGDAVAWRSSNTVQWTVATEAGDALFRKFCPNQLTPCTLTYNPTNRNYRTFLRKVTVSEVESETGPWVY